MPRPLRNRRDFARVYAEADKRVGRLFVLYLLAAEADATAVVASRKLGKAVRRNRAKRLLREALRAVDVRAGGSSGPQRGVWVVAVARRAITGAGFQEVRRELAQLVFGRDAM